jgi:hypothetical protein
MDDLVWMGHNHHLDRSTHYPLGLSTPYRWTLLLLTIQLSRDPVLTYINFALQALAKDRDGTYAAAMYTFMRAFGMCLDLSSGAKLVLFHLLHAV